MCGLVVIIEVVLVCDYEEVEYVMLWRDFVLVCDYDEDDHVMLWCDVVLMCMTMMRMIMIYYDEAVV